MQAPILDAQPEIKLTIALDTKTGAVNVTGPINDRLFCFGLLEMAKDAINAHQKQEQSRIMLARPMPNLVKQ